VRKRGREEEKERGNERKRIAGKKDEDGGESRVSLITGLDLIMVATSSAARRIGRFSFGAAVASNEVAANGPDMDEKLSRLNARASARPGPFFVITRALPL